MTGDETGVIPGSIVDHWFLAAFYTHSSVIVSAMLDQRTAFENPDPNRANEQHFYIM